MSGVRPFDQCIARPDEGGRSYPLREHLLKVKEAIEERLGKTMLEERGGQCLVRLAGLAGLCHDLAKAHREWQRYIRGERRKGPNHAPEGAFLFSFLGYALLKQENRWQDCAIYWLWLIRDIADHHGALKNLEEKQWMKDGDWDEMDLPGIKRFVHETYPELQTVEITEQTLEEWGERIDKVFEEAYDQLDVGYSLKSKDELMRQLVIWRELTTALVAGDRFHVSPTATTWFSREDYCRLDGLLDDFTREQAGQGMAAVRSAAQQEILRQLAKDPLHRMYTLEMPTGYGKTITALRLAIWLGREQGYEKIIYVGPYLSILEQNSGVMEKVLKVQVLEHHSLAFLEPDKGQHADEEDGEGDESLSGGQLIMEAWANAIVCTSFQQWCKALFPAKAQDTLRRAYLKRSVVIIDEPQIFKPENWNVFLCGLEAAAELYDLRIIFLSATMPPFTYGLKEQPGSLAVKPEQPVERYQVVQMGEMDEQGVDDYLLARPEPFQAAILNTITDAYLVYKKLAPRVKPENLKLLHGMMVPLHKQVEIAKIKEHQKKIAEIRRKQDEKKSVSAPLALDPFYVISTQIIEAGVDLSFGHVLRARPILPSLVQAAGRVNRNGEAEIGTLTLVTFLREGKKNTRGAIYPKTLQKLTDDLLKSKTVWLESEVSQLIKDYYQQMFAQNSYEANKQAIVDAYEGDWPSLGRFEPFGEDDYRLPVFVPWHGQPGDEEFYPERFVKLQKRLQFYPPEEVYAHYTDRKYYHGLSFQEKKELMILLHHYVINVPVRLAISLVGEDSYERYRIPSLLNKSDYDPVAGLAKRSVEGFDSFI